MQYVKEAKMNDNEHVIPDKVLPIANEIKHILGTFNEDISNEDVWIIITITTLSFKEDNFTAGELLNESIAFCKRIGLDGK